MRCAGAALFAGVFGGEAVVGRGWGAELDEQAALYPTGQFAEGPRLGVAGGCLDVGAGKEGFAARGEECPQAGGHFLVRQVGDGAVQAGHAAEVQVFADGIEQFLLGGEGDAADFQVARDLLVVAIGNRSVAADAQAETADAGQFHAVSVGKVVGQEVGDDGEGGLHVCRIERGGFRCVFAEVLFVYFVLRDDYGIVALCLGVGGVGQFVEVKFDGWHNVDDG